MIRPLNRALGLLGLKIVAARAAKAPVADDLELEFHTLYERCKPFTMTSVERMYAAYQSARYVAEKQLPGAIVECGVWKGGSSMMIMMTLLARGITDREVYMYDTFEGMVEPGARDIDFRGETAQKTWQVLQKDGKSGWCYSSLDEVRQNVELTGYPLARVRLIEGKVEETIPAQAPTQIALLRLDTDWYESTYHELQHLYPRLTDGGVLIIDDYGFWQGAREATDQYFRELKNPVLLSRIDATGRLMLKVK
jgi:O-methyltransferase